MRYVPPHDDVVFLEINVVPLKRRCLADPHSCPCHAKDERIVIREPLSALGLDLVQFLDCEGIYLFFDLLGRPVELAEFHHGINKDDAFIYRLLQHYSQDSDHQPNGVFGVLLRLLDYPQLQLRIIAIKSSRSFPKAGTTCLIMRNE